MKKITLILLFILIFAIILQQLYFRTKIEKIGGIESANESRDKALIVPDVMYSERLLLTGFFDYSDSFYVKYLNSNSSEIGKEDSIFDKLFFLGNRLISSIKINFYLICYSFDVWKGATTSGKEVFIASVETRLKQVYDSSTSNIIMGMLLGRVDHMPTHLYHLFEVTGTQHVLAISGFNVSFFALLATSLYGKIVSKSMLILLNIAVILVYAWILSFSPGLFRAFSMFFISTISWLLNRQKSAIYSFIITVVLAIIIDIQIFFSIGFQLSSMATLGILLYSSITRDKTHILELSISHFPLVISSIKNYIYDSFVISLVAQIAVLPLLLYYFGSFSLIGVVATIFVSWMIPLILLCGISMLFLQFIVPFQFQLVMGLPLLFLVKVFLFLLELLNFEQLLVITPTIGISTTVCLYFLIFSFYGFLYFIKNIKKQQNNDKIYHFNF